MTTDAGELMALRKRLADEITLFSKDKHMLLGLIDARIAASQPDREAVANDAAIQKAFDIAVCTHGMATREQRSRVIRDTVNAILSLLSVQVDGEQKITPLTKPSTATETAGGEA